MECHEGAKMIKTFRGLIGDDAQDTINLHTNDGKTGYRIVKLSVIGIDPRTVNAEQMLKIYKVRNRHNSGCGDNRADAAPDRHGRNGIRCCSKA